jgi:hypothetical protein
MKIWTIEGTAKSTELVFARGPKSAQEYAIRSAMHRFNGCVQTLGFTDCELYIYRTNVEAKNYAQGSYSISLYAVVFAEFEDGPYEELKEEELEKLVSALPRRGFAGFNIQWEENVKSSFRGELDELMEEVA